MPEVKQGGDVALFIEKWMQALLDHPFRLNAATFRITAKVGIALFSDAGANADILLKNAEAALKQAKASHNRYLLHTQKMAEMMAGMRMRSGSVPYMKAYKPAPIHHR